MEPTFSEIPKPQKTISLKDSESFIDMSQFERETDKETALFLIKSGNALDVVRRLDKFVDAGVPLEYIARQIKTNSPTLKDMSEAELVASCINEKGGENYMQLKKLLLQK